MGEHSPLPWSLEGPDMFGDYNILHSEEAAAIGAVVSNLRAPAEVAANAAFIVKAVNNHHALMKALARFGYWFNLNDCDTWPDNDALEIPIADLRAARDLVRALVGRPVQGE